MSTAANTAAPIAETMACDRGKRPLLNPSRCRAECELGRDLLVCWRLLLCLALTGVFGA